MELNKRSLVGILGGVFLLGTASGAIGPKVYQTLDKEIEVNPTYNVWDIELKNNELYRFNGDLVCGYDQGVLKQIDDWKTTVDPTNFATFISPVYGSVCNLNYKVQQDSSTMPQELDAAIDNVAKEE